MSEGEIFSWLIGFVMGVVLATGVWFWADRAWEKNNPCDTSPASDDQAPEIKQYEKAKIEALLPEYSSPIDFEVNGPPRRKPWVVRKRELEEAARTKRKRLESFSEYV